MSIGPPDGSLASKEIRKPAPFVIRVMAATLVLSPAPSRTARVLALLAPCVLSLAGIFAGEQAPVIALSDQFGQSHRHVSPHKRPLLVVIADRRGASQIEGWVAKLYQTHGETVDIVGVADLGGVPAFMHDTLRKAFRKQCADYPILLDWQGNTAASFSRSGTGLDIFAIQPGGRIVAAVSGNLTNTKLGTLGSALDQSGIVASAR
jgi:hypothetical protein